MEPTVDLAQTGHDSVSDVIRPTGTSRFCLFSVVQESFAVDLSHLREVFRLEWITPVPGMPPVLAGVTNLRGTVIPLADLRSLLGTSNGSAQKYVAVVGQGGRQIGIMIDDVPEILTLQPDDLIDSTPSEMMADRPFLSGRLDMESRAIGLVDVSKLLAVIEGTGDRHRA